MAQTSLHSVLKAAVSNNASDVHVRENAPVCYRINGQLITADYVASRETIEQFIMETTNEKQRAVFEEMSDLDMSHREDEIGRFRVNVHRQRGLTGLTFRWVRNDVLSFAELGLPASLGKIAEARRGIIIVTGSTGCGKSTTMAAMLQYVNETRSEHVVTIEDPIEFEYEDRCSVFEQREVGLDTPDFASALRHVLRQDPDVIMVGEMRDRASFEAALRASETGHLVITTLHASNASQTISRILDFYEKKDQDPIRDALAENLVAVISQRLIPLADGTGRAPANEILINTPVVAKLLRENRLDHLDAAIQSGQGDGMQTYNQSLLELVRQRKVRKSDALPYSDNPEALKMNFEGISLSAEGGIVG